MPQITSLILQPTKWHSQSLDASLWNPHETCYAHFKTSMPAPAPPGPPVSQEILFLELHQTHIAVCPSSDKPGHLKVKSFMCKTQMKSHHAKPSGYLQIATPNHYLSWKKNTRHTLNSVLQKRSRGKMEALTFSKRVLISTTKQTSDPDGLLVPFLS